MRLSRQRPSATTSGAAWQWKAGQNAPSQKTTAAQMSVQPRVTPVVEPSSRIKGHLGTAAVIIGAMLFAVFAQSLVLGQFIVCVYGIVAIVRRFKSRTSFLLATMTIAIVVLLQILRPEDELSSNYAIYSFWLVLIGVVSLLREVSRAHKAAAQAVEK